MKNMTVEEIKKMVGTEFIYVFEDRSEVPAVIAAFDEKIGFTCLATSLTCSDGYDLSDYVDENGNMCLVGVDRDRESGSETFMVNVSSYIYRIKHLGYYICGSYNGFGYDRSDGGNASCSF